VKYDLIVIGAGPGGLMAARTASREGLKVILVERKQNIPEIKRLCSMLMRLGPGGFSSDHVPKDKVINQVRVTFESDLGEHIIHLKNLNVTIPYHGGLRTYHNEVWISPSGYSYGTLPTNDDTYGYCIDKEALLAGLLNECIEAGCEVRAGTKCTDVIEEPDGVKCSLATGNTTSEVLAHRAVIADGAFSPLLEKLGFNEGRTGPPPLKFLGYALDRIDAPYPESRFLKLAIPSIHKGQVSVGLWPHDTYQIQISVPIGSPENLTDLMDRIMHRSPFASWFKHSKIVSKLACNMALLPNVEKPARGRIICVGDNAAYAETAIKGALGCGYVAGKAIKKSLEGGDGNAMYNDYWDHAFYAHSAEYRAFGRRTLPPARMLDDKETDTLYKWIIDNHLHGMLQDVVADNLERLKADLPQIAAKIVVPTAPR